MGPWDTTFHKISKLLYILQLNLLFVEIPYCSVCYMQPVTHSSVFFIITNVEVHIKWLPIAISIFIEYVLVKGSIQANGWNNTCMVCSQFKCYPKKIFLVNTTEVKESIP